MLGPRHRLLQPLAAKPVVGHEQLQRRRRHRREASGARPVELAYRAPCFHDGRGATLKARFTPVGGGDAHGKVTQLSPAQVDDLVTYLESR